MNLPGRTDGHGIANGCGVPAMLNVPRGQHVRPAFAMPPGAVDTHMHVVGPEDRYPWNPDRSYTPPDASLQQYRDMCRQTGLERVVLVQPSIYGTDNRAMIDGLNALGSVQARGVAAIDPRIPEADLLAMHDVGVRGVRIGLLDGSTAGLSSARNALASLARRIKPLGWHIQIISAIGIVGALAADFGPSGSVGVPVVIDHLGMPEAALGLEQPGFEELVNALGDGRCWVKLSGFYRVAGQSAPPEAALPYARALAKANPDQVLWGSDWPHMDWPNAGHHVIARVAGHGPFPAFFRDLDVGGLLGLLREAVSDDAGMRRVLVDNPARLYGFRPAV